VLTILCPYYHHNKTNNQNIYKVDDKYKEISSEF